MSTTRDLSKFTRQELYDLIWSAPAWKLAPEFGISDVALAKRCKKQNVPRPSLGYWAKLAAGQNPPKKPLPPPPDELFVQVAKKSVGKRLSLPAAEEPLHPLATELMQALPTARLDSNKRASLQVPTLPEVNASKALADRIARSFHVILKGVEPLGITFRKSQSSYSDGFFFRRQDRLYLRIEETMLEPDGTIRRRPSWDHEGSRSRPSGLLCFDFKSDRYSPKKEYEWIETTKVPLEQLLAQIVTSIRHHYLEAHNEKIQRAIEEEKRRIEWERKHREWEAAEAIRVQEEAKRKHTQAIASAKQRRTEDLLKASQWWHLHESLLSFIYQCAQHWQSSGGPTPEQESWLTWARLYAKTLSPFETGYPDPARDGAFDPGAVPFGGPYPPTRNFPNPQA